MAFIVLRILEGIRAGVDGAGHPIAESAPKLLLPAGHEQTGVGLADAVVDRAVGLLALRLRQRLGVGVETDHAASPRGAPLRASVSEPSQTGLTRLLRPGPAGRLDELYIRTYNLSVRYVWDPEKARQNLQKHGVDFADSVAALEDDLALTQRDPGSEAEERFITMGMDPSGQLLVVVYTWRGERIRIISARKATSRERRQYEEA